MAQVRLKNFTGEEFKLNYRDDLEAHLNAYGKANQAEQRRLKPGDPAIEKLRNANHKTLELIDGLDRYCQVDRPFSHPYYWAAFTCQGLA